jgi:hypothetical protein
MANIQDNTTLAFFAQQMIKGLTADPLLGRLLQNSGRFVNPTGAYKLGQTININVTNGGGATNFLTDFSTNPARTPAKSTFDQYALTLNTLAYKDILWDEIDMAFSSASVEGGTSASIKTIIQNYLEKFGEDIEGQLYLDTFNVASIDANRFGVAGDAFVVDDVEDLSKEFSDAKWKGKVNLVLDPAKFTALRKSLRGAYSNVEIGDLAFARNGFVVSDLPKFTVYESTELKTLTEMTNITGTGTSKVGFAFADDAAALFNPRIAENSRNIDVDSMDVSYAGMNLNITSETDNSKAYKEDNDVMRALFGSVIYRPTTVFPILGTAQ